MNWAPLLAMLLGYNDTLRDFFVPQISGNLNLNIVKTNKCIEFLICQISTHSACDGSLPMTSVFTNCSAVGLADAC